MKKTTTTMKKERMKRKLGILLVTVALAIVATAILYGITYLLKIAGYLAESLLASGIWCWLAIALVIGTIIFCILVPKKRRHRKK